MLPVNQVAAEVLIDHEYGCVHLTLAAAKVEVEPKR